MPRLLRFADLSDAELAELYAYPVDRRVWVRANFVASIDGAVTVDGRVGGLTTRDDQHILTLLRNLADVVLVGAGTVRVEGYTGLRVNSEIREWRLRLGLAPVPPLAVVSGRAKLDPHSPLFTDTVVPPVILTSADAPVEAKQALRDAGGDVIELDAGAPDASALLAALVQRGLTRILCEGGPTLLGQLISAGELDELCLTTSPVLVGGSSDRIAVSARVTDTAMHCSHVLFAEDGSQFARWIRC
ncbi:pyrimidine reductase family protein [Nocardia amamiensis]|uniref:Pyrimidine reductase family protein n=1 Tax=Nocardia amamiensis TaxID=404578 RepID=A0ABS0CYE7_9NOCA|nr:pyrimidine reductase family protein [Nocardia amamiensis]MBF6301630.1 pyrimidine reductase family protein [Nocardia amamiensis]